MTEAGAMERAAAALRRARQVVAITGAGISAESGVPTFRGSGGLWRTFRAEQLATPEAFARDPLLVWQWYWWRRGRIASARANPGHLALARFESRFPCFTLLTQNVDGLHAAAGSRSLIELHGNIWRARCVAQRGHVFDQRADPIPCCEVGGELTPPARAESGPGERDGNSRSDRLPACPSCGAWLRPDVVWFGEGLDPTAVDRSVDAVRRCDVLLVIGTSAVVYPVAALPAVAAESGALIIEVNIENTPLTAEADIVLREPSGAVLPRLEREL